MSRFPLPFPECPACGKDGARAYHRNCGGVMWVDPETEIVSCERCGKSWHIVESGYCCSCGNRFEASEVKDELDRMLRYCLVVAAELQSMMEADRKRKKMSDESLREFVLETARQVARNAGYLLNMIVETVVALLTGI